MTVGKTETPNPSARTEAAQPARTVVSLARPRTEPATAPRPQQRRRRWLALSFALFVFLPSVFGTFYYAVIASGRYVAGAGFAIRGMDGGGGLDVVGAFTGLAAGGSTASDSYIVLKYLKSRDILDQLQKDFAFREKFGADDVDYLSRLNPDRSVEKTVDYWDSMIATSFDATSGIITFNVDAFAPEDANQLANLILDYVQTLVNRLSETARHDSVQFAEAEVARAEARLREVLQQVRIFRDQRQSIDPAASAQLHIELLGALKKELIDIRAGLAAFGPGVADSSPAKTSLRRRAEAVEAQIAEQSEVDASVDPDSALSGLLAAYEALEVEKTFAEQTYASALSSLEQARVEADRKQRYLAVYSYPALPEDAIYPRRMRNILMIISISICLWGIGTLIAYSVRDHMS
ncbi:hypothetical protein [Phaeovulum sp.]|uniref:hypothetical protein n=1 Tax=Phaeovulum sp. TaxID=2934796 RepID=UPI0039E718EF